MNTIEFIREAKSERDTAKQSSTDLSQAVRVRLSVEVLERLDRVVNFCEEREVYGITRSSIIRDGIVALLSLIEVEFPEVLE